ncbi:MAG: PqqD family protein [Bacteroidales bacterium]|nr:PqqD family protein [Bacteroidales bacterium]
MHLKKKYKLRTLGPARIIVTDTDDGAVNLSQVLSFNDTAAFLWETASKQDFTCQTLADALCEAYEVSPEQALEDATRTVETWKQYHLVAE